MNKKNPGVSIGVFVFMVNLLDVKNQKQIYFGLHEEYMKSGRKDKIEFSAFSWFAVNFDLYLVKVCNGFGYCKSDARSFLSILMFVSES